MRAITGMDHHARLRIKCSCSFKNKQTLSCFFYAHGCFAYMHVCTLYVCLVPWEARRGCGGPGNIIRVLGPKLSTVCSPIHVPLCLFLLFSREDFKYPRLAFYAIAEGGPELLILWLPTPNVEFQVFRASLSAEPRASCLLSKDSTS